MNKKLEYILLVLFLGSLFLHKTYILCYYYSVNNYQRKAFCVLTNDKLSLKYFNEFEQEEYSVPISDIADYNDSIKYVYYCRFFPNTILVSSYQKGIGKAIFNFTFVSALFLFVLFFRRFFLLTNGSGYLARSSKKINKKC